MCEAIRKIRAKGIEEGIEKGRKEGIEKGRKEGREKGREEGIEQIKHDVVVNALRIRLSLKTIQKVTGLTTENIKSIAQSIAML